MTYLTPSPQATFYSTHLHIHSHAKAVLKALRTKKLQVVCGAPVLLSHTKQAPSPSLSRGCAVSRICFAATSPTPVLLTGLLIGTSAESCSFFQGRPEAAPPSCRFAHSSSSSWCAGILCTREGFMKSCSTGRCSRRPWLVSSCNSTLTSQLSAIFMS